MVKFYTGSGSSSGADPAVAPLAGPGGGGGGTFKFEPDNFDDVGKTQIDLTDPVKSIGEGLGSLGQFVGGLAGGIGDIGIEGGPTIGGAFGAVGGAVGGALGAVGGVELPYLGDDPTRTNATIGDIPGMALDAIVTPGREVEKLVARQRLEAGRKGEFYETGFDPLGIATLIGRAAGRKHDPSSINPEFMDRLEAGESIESIAEDMVARNAGFAENQTDQLLTQIVFDPLNFIAPGASKAAKAVKGTGLAVRSADDIASIGLGTRFAGTVYNAASRGLSAAGQGTMGLIVGPATKGVFHSLGTKPYFGIKDGLARLSGDYANAFEDALARGSAQFPSAVVARHLADEATLASRIGSDEALDALRTVDVPTAVESRIAAKRAIDPATLERQVEEMADRVIPTFVRTDAAVMADETARKIALITGASPEDAARAIGNVSRDKARTVHLAFYGKAGHDLAAAKAAAVGAKNIDVERLTIIAPQTLTDERAGLLLNAIKAGDGVAVEEAVARYEVLGRKFGTTTMDHAKVRDYVQNLRRNDLLPKAVKLPKSGKNKLVAPLGEWRQRYAPFDYEIGFAPKEGWKSFIDETGEVHITDPFVHFVDEADSLTHRNPLGRMVDGLMRGVTQTKIIQTAKVRFMERAGKAGMTDAEVDRVFGAVLHEARESGSTPRGLGVRGGREYDRIFREALGDERFAEISKLTSPTFLVMRAFEGNLKQIGLTQKVTGLAKAGGAPFGNIIAAVAEGIYPLMRFKYRPVFQIQELIESPVWNKLRGVRPAVQSKDAQKVMLELADIGPEFRYVFEAGYVTHLLDGKAATWLVNQGKIGRALAKVVPEGGVQGFKERRRVAQVFSEHGEYFAESVNKVNPRLWRTMTDAYGTTDPRAVAGHWIEERFRLASDHVKAFDGGGASGPVARASVPARVSVDKAFEETFHPALQNMIREKVEALSAKYGLPVTVGVVGKRGARGILDPAGAGADALATPSTILLHPRIASREFWKFQDEMDASFLASTGTQGNVGRGPRALVTHEFGHVVQASIGASKARRWLESVIARADFKPPSDYAQQSAKISARQALRQGERHHAELFAELFADAELKGHDPYGILGFIARHSRPRSEIVAEADQAVDNIIAAIVGKDPANYRAAQVVNRSADEETVMQAFLESWRQSMTQAFKTHYFSPQRGWLERTINHPYLGLYPVSYMWGKVIPELARFLVLRPFGLDAPLVGLAAYEKVQETITAAIATDPEFAQHVTDNADAIYAVQMLVPGLPDDIPVNAPGWARHLSADLLADKKIDPESVLARESADIIANASPARDVRDAARAGADLADTASDIFANLTKAAKEYDGMFPQSQPTFQGLP